MSIPVNNKQEPVIANEPIIVSEITTVKNPIPEVLVVKASKAKDPEVKESYRQRNMAKARYVGQRKIIEKNLKEKEDYELKMIEEKKIAEEGLKNVGKQQKKRNVTPDSDNDSDDDVYKQKYKKYIEIAEIKDMVYSMNNRLNKMYGMQKSKLQLKQKQPIINIPPSQIIQEKAPKSQAFKNRLMDLANM